MSGTAAARLHLHEARMRIRIFLFDGNESCLSKISVRQAKGLPTASFRFRLTMDILAVQLCASSLPARTRDLHLLEPAHDWRTKKAPAKPALCAVSLLLLIIIIKNVNIKFDIFSCFYRFAVLHNIQPILLYIFTFRQRNSKAATSASLSRPLFPFLCKLLYLFLE